MGRAPGSCHRRRNMAMGAKSPVGRASAPTSARGLLHLTVERRGTCLRWLRGLLEPAWAIAEHDIADGDIIPVKLGSGPEGRSGLGTAGPRRTHLHQSHSQWARAT